MTGENESATRHRDLLTGIPYWLRRGYARVSAAPLSKNVVADVAVVGAGVTGALVSDALLCAGKKVAVIDRRGPGHGSTPASTALLQFEIDQPLLLLQEKIGRERAVRAYWRSATAVDSLRARIVDLGLRSSFRQRQTVFLPGNLMTVSDLKLEASARMKVGLRSRFIERNELRDLTGIHRNGAVLSNGSGELDPSALVTGVWRSAISRGAQIYAPAEVIEIHPGRCHVTLLTDSGYTVRAKHAVFATGYEVVKLIKKQRHRIVSTWAMATSPQTDRLWHSRCLIWEAADPYLYLRTTLDGRVVVGGEDEEISDAGKRDALTPQKIKAIRAKLKNLMPKLETQPEFSWAGCFGETPTGLPSIGAIPGAANCFAILGYGGNGITFSVIAAQLIQRAILGIRDPDQDLFEF